MIRHATHYLSLVLFVADYCFDFLQFALIYSKNTHDVVPMLITLMSVLDLLNLSPRMNRLRQIPRHLIQPRMGQETSYMVVGQVETNLLKLVTIHSYHSAMSTTHMKIEVDSQLY